MNCKNEIMVTIPLKEYDMLRSLENFDSKEIFYFDTKKYIYSKLNHEEMKELFEKVENQNKSDRDIFYEYKLKCNTLVKKINNLENQLNKIPNWIKKIFI